MGYGIEASASKMLGCEDFEDQMKMSKQRSNDLKELLKLFDIDKIYLDSISRYRYEIYGEIKMKLSEEKRHRKEINSRKKRNEAIRKKAEDKARKKAEKKAKKIQSINEGK